MSSRGGSLTGLIATWFLLNFLDFVLANHYSAGICTYLYCMGLHHHLLGGGFD